MDNEEVYPWRYGVDKQYRVEFFQYGKWRLYETKTIGKGHVADVWEIGEKGTFHYEDQARKVAVARSLKRPLKYRVTRPHTKQVVVVYKNGVEQTKEGGMPPDKRFRAEFYQSEASKRPTGPGTGANAPEEGGSWYQHDRTRSLEGSIHIYERWVEYGGYRLCRIVELDIHLRVVRVVAISNQGSGKEGGQVTAARAEFYDSPASKRPTGPGTGQNAPDDGTGRWVSSFGCTTLREAERLYNEWSRSTGYNKRCRIVAPDGTVLKDTIYPGGVPPEGATAMEYANIEEALTVPRLTMIEKVEASIEAARAKHDEQQQQLLEENAARITKAQKVANDGWLVMKLVQFVVHDISRLEDADEVYKAVADYFGKQPGTAEFVADQGAEKLLSVLNAATDENLAVKPGTNLYNYL